MPALTVANQISTSIDSYLPSTLAAVLATEAAAKQLPGETKLQTVVNAVMVATDAATAVPNPTVAGIAGLANLLVSLLNATGVFNHGATAPAPVVATNLTGVPSPGAAGEPTA